MIQTKEERDTFANGARIQRSMAKHGAGSYKMWRHHLDAAARLEAAVAEYDRKQPNPPSRVNAP